MYPSDLRAGPALTHVEVIGHLTRADDVAYQRRWPRQPAPDTGRGGGSIDQTRPLSWTSAQALPALTSRSTRTSALPDHPIAPIAHPQGGQSTGAWPCKCRSRTTKSLRLSRRPFSPRSVKRRVGSGDELFRWRGPLEGGPRSPPRLFTSVICVLAGTQPVALLPEKSTLGSRVAVRRLPQLCPKRVIRLVRRCSAGANRDDLCAVV